MATTDLQPRILWVQVLDLGLIQGAIALEACLSLINNGVLPFALAMVPADKAGLGTGMFFSGGALAANLFAAFFKQPGAITQTTTILVAVVGLGIAGVAIATSSISESNIG